jgi:hypothetical protein
MLKFILVNDRYHGSYSEALWTAWANECPEEIDDSDIPCMIFWDTYTGFVGKGTTPTEAIEHLLTQLTPEDVIKYD